MTDPTLLQKRKRISYKFLLILFLIAIASSLYWWIFWRFKEYTDDAYVEGNQVLLTPLQPGIIQSILTDETYLVKEGQLLIEMDPTDAEIALQAAKENLAKTIRKICQDILQVFALQSEIQSRKAEFIKAAQDFEHRYHVLDAGGVSLEDFEHSEAALRSSFFLLQMTEILFEKAYAFVRNTTIQNHPEVLFAAETVRQAWVNLYRTRIYAPVEGLVAQRKVQVGMQVHSGDPLLAIIPLSQIWVNANYKETQMKRMRIGQHVDLTSDLYGREVVFHGTIAGLPGGAGNAFSLLPPQNLSGNWIKIVQRLPVRVELNPEEIRSHPLRIGLSMEATTYVEEDDGLLVPQSNQGAPQYLTPIFKREESGDLAEIQQIILNNIDPTLSSYLDQAILLEENL